MKIIWLGQAGLLMEKDGRKIIIDPYLSDACHKLNPASWRRTPLDEAYLKIKPDVLVLTHDHIDHTDKETLCHYLTADSGILVLASGNAWNTARTYGGNNNYVKFDRHTRWTWEGITFTAVKAEHSDERAIGVIVDDGEKKYYITGDTLYNTDIFPDLPEDIYAVFLPINGKGNNMNAADAAAFAKKTGAKYAIPVHFGMFDEIDPTIFAAENRVIPTAYEAVKLEG